MNNVLFVAGTDTGVGKTRVGVLLAEGLTEAGGSVGVLKPFASGDWSDARALCRAAGGRQPLSSVVVHFCRLPLAPAAVRGTGPRAQREADKDIQESVLRARTLARNNGAVIVEGVGGVLTPLGGRRTSMDLICRLGLPVWLVARPGLGTLNHSLLTLESLRLRGLSVRRIVLSGYRGNTRVERTNVSLLEKMAGVPVTRVPWVRSGRSTERVRGVLVSAWRQDFREGK